MARYYDRWNIMEYHNFIIRLVALLIYFVVSKTFEVRQNIMSHFHTFLMDRIYTKGNANGPVKEKYQSRDIKIKTVPAAAAIPSEIAPYVSVR